MSEDDARDLAIAHSSGYPDVASYRAAIKASRDLERLEQEAEAETDRLVAGIRDLVGFKRLEDQFEDEVAELESAAARMERHRESAAEAQSDYGAAIKSAAAKLLATVGIKIEVPDESAPEVDAAQLQARIEAEKLAAAAAQEALHEINQRLAIKRKQLAGVRSRQEFFLKPAVREVFEPLGHRLVKALNEVRYCYSLLSALNAYNGNSAYDDIRIPRPKLDSISAKCRRSAKIISSFATPPRANSPIRANELLCRNNTSKTRKGL
jgi:hypothetical protein